MVRPGPPPPQFQCWEMNLESYIFKRRLAQPLLNIEIWGAGASNFSKKFCRQAWEPFIACAVLPQACPSAECTKKPDKHKSCQPALGLERRSRNPEIDARVQFSSTLELGGRRLKTISNHCNISFAYRQGGSFRSDFQGHAAAIFLKSWLKGVSP